MSLVADADDPVLEAQLAHLEAIEQRHEQLYAQQLAEAARTEALSGEPPLPEEAWPAAVGAPPPPDGIGLQPYVDWIERARAVLSARASRNRDELQRLVSQWVHISRNLARFQPEEVAGVVEAQSRVRERVAADETCAHVLLLVRAWLLAWEEVAGGEDTELLGVAEGRREAEPPVAPPADVALVRRLLDEAAADRAGDARRLLDAVLEALAGVALDMEVVQREASRAPDDAAAALQALRDRLGGVVDDLRARPGADLVEPEPGEPLQAALRRCVDRWQGRLAGDVAWSGAEPAGAEVRAAVLWVVQEFLAAGAAAGATRAGVALASGAEATVLRLAADAPALQPGAAEPGWLLRCRARAAVAGGALLVAEADGCDLEIAFPVPPGEAG
jgi:hypothetical protein